MGVDPDERQIFVPLECDTCIKRHSQISPHPSPTAQSGKNEPPIFKSGENH